MRLRHKLLAIVGSAIAAALLLAGAVLIAWDLVRLRRELLGDLEATAALIAEHSTAALAFDDAEVARENLGSLRSQGYVVTGCLYDGRGYLFAEYHRSGSSAQPCPPLPEETENRVTSDMAELWAAVLLEGTPTGMLYLRSDLGNLRDRQQVQLWTLAAALAVALGGGLLLSLRLQRIVTAPVGALADTAAAVTRRRDYSLRAVRRSDDEIGDLVDSFNQMLAEIEAADASLREAKEELEGANLVLRHEVDERQRAESEKAGLLEREQAAREEAEAANRLKDEFLATLSHELRTPLNAILGWVALLQAGKTDPETLERATTVIERNARAQAQLVEDLLDVSRIITGKLSLHMGAVDVVPVLESVVDTVRPAAEAKRIRVDLEVEVELPPLQADAARLQQMVWNLASNAVKFTPADGRVWIRARRCDDMVEIEVEDQGVGISRDFLPHVFERFRQQDSSTTRTHGGLGLGLAIVRHLVELHGGEVEVESPGAGEGATFKMRLPAAPAARAAGDAAVAETGGDLEGVRVLLVEDEADTRELYRVILERSGARVAAVASAGEALRRFETEPPDVLVSDIGLSGMDGYELMERIRRFPGGEGDVPAVALTAYAGAEHERRALEAGFQVHAAKPVGADELVRLVRGVAVPR